MGDASNNLIPLPPAAAARADNTLYIGPHQPVLFAEEVDAARACKGGTRRGHAARLRERLGDLHGLVRGPACRATASRSGSGRRVPRSRGCGRRFAVDPPRRLAAITAYHLDASLTPPQEREGSIAIKKVMAGIRRTHGVAPKRKAAADGDRLQAIKDDDLRSIRDRAVLAIGMAAALRRSELVALDVDDIELVATGLRLTVRHSKTDQEGMGAVIAIPEGRRIKPKELLLAWVAAAGITTGPLFLSLSAKGKVLGTRMSDKGVARVVKARAAAAGLDIEDFSGHSLRSGFITEAARQGATVFIDPAQ